MNIREFDIFDRNNMPKKACINLDKITVFHDSDNGMVHAFIIGMDEPILINTTYELMKKQWLFYEH